MKQLGPCNELFQQDCLDGLRKIPDASIDLVFADPPYNLQLRNSLARPSGGTYTGCNSSWDQFETLAAYDRFTADWLTHCRRILKPNGALWVMGSYHNIFRVGVALQNLGFWIQNDVSWVKSNPTPNFRGTRLQNAHETLIWAGRSRESKCTFNYHAMKAFNDDKQMRSVWHDSICTGNERLRKIDGSSLHPTQKPEALLSKILLSTTLANDLVLDPFAGTGTSLCVAKKLGRRYIGFEREAEYYNAASIRLAETTPFSDDLVTPFPSNRSRPRVSFGQLVCEGLIRPGCKLTNRKKTISARVRADGSIRSGEVIGSIHQVAKKISDDPSLNGWTYWRFKSGRDWVPIDSLRGQYFSKRTSAHVSTQSIG